MGTDSISDSDVDSPSLVCEVCQGLWPIKSDLNSILTEEQLTRYGIRVENLSTTCHQCILLKAIYDGLEKALEEEYPDFRSTNNGPGTHKEIYLSPQKNGRVITKFSWFRKAAETSVKRGDPFFYRYIDIHLCDEVSLFPSYRCMLTKSQAWDPGHCRTRQSA
jgi:hypothetical protein